MGLNGLLSTGYVGDGLDEGVTGKKVADQRLGGVVTADGIYGKWRYEAASGLPDWLPRRGKRCTRPW